jgi:hypothetical protein
MDALLPTVLGGEGPTTKLRVGDALTHGKLRIAGVSPPSGPGIVGGDGNTRAELYLWHYFGDPTMQMFGGGSAPIIFNPNVFKAIYKELPVPKAGDPPPFLVEITLPPGLAGQPISLLRNGEVIGKALAGDGSATVPALFNDGPPNPGELEIALEADGAAPVKAPVDGVPARPKATTLTQTCPSPVTFNAQGPTTVAVNGTLAGAPAGSTVTVTFTRPTRIVGNTPVTPTTPVQVTTDVNGNWTASVQTSDRLDIGKWSASSSYTGASGYLASQAGPCDIVVA